MAKAEITKKEVEVTLTLTEEEADVLLLLTGACMDTMFGGVPEPMGVYKALSDALNKASSQEFRFAELTPALKIERK